MESVSLSSETWDSFSPPRVSDEVVRLSGPSDERNMTRHYNGHCHPRTEGKAAWETVKILFSTIPTFSELPDQGILHRFLVLPPPFHKSQEEISFKGRGL
jgi:hypothetical protein